MKNVIIVSCLAVVVLCLIMAFCLGVDAYRTECVYLIGLLELAVIGALVTAFVTK